MFIQNGTSWIEQPEITASDGAAGDVFGWSVAFSGLMFAASAPDRSVGANQYQGVAYLFDPPPTTLTLTPSSLSFSNQAVDTVSAAKTLTLKNTGSSPLYPAVIALAQGTSFTISNNTCGHSLAVNKMCKVSVAFTPTQLGAAADSLSFVDNTKGSPQIISVSGTGLAQASLTPAAISFATTKVGKTSSQTVTLRNNLPTALNGISYTLASPFAVSPLSTCGTTLDSKKSCTFKITFSPTAAGSATGTLTVTDSSNDSPYTVSVEGDSD